MQLRSSLRLALLTLVLFALARPAAAVAEDAPFVGWSSLCPGSLFLRRRQPERLHRRPGQCVDKVIRQMTTRFEPLASSCEHDAIFAVTYLRVTEEYRRTVETPTFFDDTSFVNHEDVSSRATTSPPTTPGPGEGPPLSRLRGESRSTQREIVPFPRTAICSSVSTHTSSATFRSSFTASGSSSRTAPAGSLTTIA